MSPRHEGAFLRRLAAGGILPGETMAVIVAHPDDETIGLGAQLPRMPGVTIVHVTDGAPRNPAEARSRGFDSPEDYAAARQRELVIAMEIAGVPTESLVSIGIRDQEAAFHLAAIAQRIAMLLRERRIAVVFTHAFEGGHPDHEAAAFSVHWAARLIARDCPGSVPLIVEMPLYHAGPEGWVIQRFPDEARPALAIWLDGDECAFKARLYAAHASQAEVLALFPIGVERFRVAPDYDFHLLPNGGDLLYERHGWGLTAERWLREVASAESELSEAA